MSKRQAQVIGVVIILALVGFSIFYRHPAKPIVTSVLPAEMQDISEFRKLDYQKQLDLVKSYAKSDPINAWKYVKDVFLINGQQVSNAHEFAHLIGNAMYVKFGLEGITYCDQTFAFGCYHGVSEKLLVDKGPMVVKDVQQHCTNIFPPETTQNFTGCIHGMGHGLFTYEHFNVQKALNDCDQLDELYKTYCYDGVFMEHSDDLAEGEFDPNHPWQFCEALAEKYQYNCARYQSHIFSSKWIHDLPKVGAACASSKKQNISFTCFESLGYYVTQTNTGKLDGILANCRELTGIGIDHCIYGASREVEFQAYPNWQKTKDGLCDVIDDSLKVSCRQHLQFTPAN